MQDVISTLTLQAMRPGEALHEAIVEVGKPYFSAQGGGIWYCAVAMDGLYPVDKVAGRDSFQALCLAVRLIANLLADYEKDGGVIYYPPAEGEAPLFGEESISGGCLPTETNSVVIRMLARTTAFGEFLPDAYRWRNVRKGPTTDPPPHQHASRARLDLANIAAVLVEMDHVRQRLRHFDRDISDDG
jgi:hypothetical protein